VASESNDRLRRWGLVAAILGAAGHHLVLVIRAIPGQGEARLEIAGWKAPVGVVVSTNNVASHLPGIVVRTLLGDKPMSQVNRGRVEEVGQDSLRIASLARNKEITYTLTSATTTVNVRNPPRAGCAGAGETVAVLTSPDTQTRSWC
jgi:hypothetical protein